jgi:hypothetical protein
VEKIEEREEEIEEMEGEEFCAIMGSTNRAEERDEDDLTYII